MEFHTVARNVFLLDKFTALAQTKGHDVANKIGACDDGSTNIGLLDVVNLHSIGHTSRVVHLLHFHVLIVDVVAYVGHGGDDVHVELTVKAFLYDLHVEESEESATKTETECNR